MAGATGGPAWPAGGRAATAVTTAITVVIVGLKWDRESKKRINAARNRNRK